MPEPGLVVISLARTPERLAAFRGANGALSAVEVFTAVDGRQVDAATREALGDTSLYTPGGVGAALSHIALWRRSAAEDRALTVFEDDAVARGDFLDAHLRLLDAWPGFDIVHWGWNFDAVMEARLAPGVGAALVADQAAMRAGLQAFRADRSPPTLLALCKILGSPAYTISPDGARALLERCLPLRPQRLQFPLMPQPFADESFDVARSVAYAGLSAWVSVPPLVVTPNDWSISTIRNAAPTLEPEAAIRAADALQARGQSAEVLAVLQSAACRTLDHPGLLTRLGTQLAAEGLLGVAAFPLRRALALQPDGAGAAYNLGALRLRQGFAGEALALFDRALAHEPNFALAHSNRGVALLALRRGDEAAAAFRAALARDPRLAEALRGLVSALLDDHGTAEAAAWLEAAWTAAASDSAAGDEAWRGELAQAWLALSLKAERSGDLAAATACASRAAEVPAVRGAALVTLANLLERQGRFEAAWAAAAESVQLAPSVPAAHANLGVALLRLGRPAEAEAAFRAAVERAPDYADAHYGLAFALLKQARFAEAWPEYDWRLRTAEFAPAVRGYSAPRWRGEPRPGATLLIAAEQGFGDVLMAARLIAGVAGRVGRVMLQVAAPLLRLLAALPGVDAVVDDRAPAPAHDLWCPLMSLMEIAGVTPAFDPAGLPALAPDAARAAHWAEALPRAGLRLGIAWQGNPGARVEYGRSIPLSAFAPLAATPGVTLVSLQKGAGVEQLDRPGLGFRPLDLGAAYRAGDFAQTAAVVANLDLVVACDTAVAHLAGALGRPVWIALGANPDWRWLAAGERSLWYESARLFRLGPEETWAGLFVRLARSLGSAAAFAPTP